MPQSDSVGCFLFIFFQCTGASPVIGDTPPIACSSQASLPAKLNTKPRLKFIPTRHSSALEPLLPAYTRVISHLIRPALELFAQSLRIGPPTIAALPRASEPWPSSLCPRRLSQPTSTAEVRVPLLGQRESMRCTGIGVKEANAMYR